MRFEVLLDTKLCPRCHRASLDNGVCVFCAPIATPVVEKLHPGWAGYDRVPGQSRREAESREEQLLREHAARLQRDKTPSNTGVWGSFVAALAVGGVVFYLWQNGLLKRTVSDSPRLGSLDLSLPSVGGLPTELRKPASAARGDLALLGRNLLEFESDAERKFTGNEDISNVLVERYRERLQRLKDTSRALEPQLTREETRVLFAFQHAEAMLDNYLLSFEGSAPDLAGAQAQAAQEQIQRALSVARGEKVENLMMVYEHKTAEAHRQERDLEAGGSGE
jgi:hypothetical protein